MTTEITKLEGLSLAQASGIYKDDSEYQNALAIIMNKLAPATPIKASSKGSVGTIRQLTYANGSKFYECQVYVGRLNGKDQKRSVRARTKTLVRALANKMKVEYQKTGITPISKNADSPTLGEMMVKYSEGQYSTEKIREATSVNYKRIVRSYFTNRTGDNTLLPDISNIKINKLKFEDIYNYMSVLVTSKTASGKRRLQPNSIHLIGILLKASLDKAVERNLINNNPIKAFKDLDLPPVKKAKREFIGELQMARLIKECEKNTHLVDNLALLNLMTGMRKCEGRGLQWKDIDFDQKLADINKSLVAVEGGLKVEPPKNDSSYRLNELITSLIEMLKKQKAKRSEELLALGKKIDGEDYIFSNLDGSWLSEGTLRHHLTRLFKTCGIHAKIDWRILRHTNITSRIRNGEIIADVSRSVGHSSVATTMDIYYDCVDGSVRESTEDLEAKLKSLLG